MLTKNGPYLRPREDGPDASRQLERDGYCVLPGVFDPPFVAALRAEADEVYANYPADGRAAGRDPAEDEDFRYEMFNRSALAQRAIGHAAILATIEPLLGEDCHVIANTCWRNPPRTAHEHGGGYWHIDSGPHIPHDPELEWDERIPYPVFAIGAHLYLEDCDLASGPTGVIPGSHKSGNPPPFDSDEHLEWRGRGVVPLTARAGDVAMFVSDVWHRRLPTRAGDRGRYFLQAHYARRDIAQRILPTSEVNHVRPDAAARATNDRMRKLLGLHRPFFYDG
jgi:ectoine hydroxylase-related dioxygenase (phytanoyl-CoA dioxygenase family)